MFSGSFWNEQGAQQLVRYEAMFKLLGDIQGIEDIAEIARRVAKQWKYFSNAANWRLTVPKDNAFIIIDGFRGEVVLGCESTLPSWDHYHLRLQRPRLIRLADANDGPEPPPHLADNSIVEIMCLPFIRAERCIGLLSTAARHHPFSELDNKFIRLFGATFADRVSDLLLRQQATQILIHKATRDPLTGLLNRGAIIDRLESQLALSRRDGQPLSIVLLDIDFFKVINDSYGHLPGDEVLREIANRLRKETRSSDSLGRYGGEEFLLVLYPCNDQDAVISAERFRHSIAATPVVITADDPLHVTVTISLGTATSGLPKALGIQDLIKLADNALYLAKSTGRNRVIAGSAARHDQ
jgi:diguanylate cyclase (GGDEF)-like protein